MKLLDWLRTTNTAGYELARRVGCSPATISRVSRGLTRPEGDLVTAIARETGGAVLPNDLFPDAVAHAPPAENAVAA
ncbi:helix-turn-helix domain-containing protein [Roseomonas elaeocarpi]|uniref:Helix-turn-helix domain-containing protein n=1 Tax=Roseomonas elaeocarpi TaxID=907779 RepID=A0ABV6JR53_9PROT